MSIKLHGIKVGLHIKTPSGEDPMGNPVYTESIEYIDDVLVSPATQGGRDELESLRLAGKSADYILAIPKGDTHTWTDTQVDIYGLTYDTYGYPTEGIDDLIPLHWNKKVLVVRHE